MRFYIKVIRPVLFLFDPEKIHHFTFLCLKVSSLIPGLLSLIFRKNKNKAIEVDILGHKFKHPVGLAAGLDKNGIAIKPLSNIGFSFLELGTVTPKPQPGNSKPRLYRLVNDKALINRMGFNNDGVDALVEKLRKRPRNVIIGGNIGKNTATPNEKAVDDYVYCFKKLLGHVDYFVVNVSCPNISDLRELQDKDSLSEILSSLMSIRSRSGVEVPVLLKVSPDLNKSQLVDLVNVVKDTGIDGLVATNTSVGRDNLKTDPHQVEQIGNGGLSGKPLGEKSTDIIKSLRKELPKPFPIIASGGIMTADDAIGKINAGADLVQIYTGFIYEGPSLIGKILEKL